MAGTRLLIAAGAAAATGDEVPPRIRSLIEDASDVLLITPVLTSKLHVWTSDFDHARHEADERLDAILGHVETIAPDSHIRVERGDEIPLTAFDDAVRVFRPDSILIALRAADHAAWQEEHLLDRVQQRFQLPITVFELNRGGKTLPPTTTTHEDVKAAGRNRPTKADSLQRKMFAVFRTPVREIQAEAEHVRDVERAGDSGATPFIAMLGVILFLLLGLILMAGLILAAYYLAG
jgi:hypothetical protein